MNGYLDKTAFYSNLPSVLASTRGLLKKANNIQLYHQFEQVKSDFIEYIEQKIVRLNKNVKQDVWAQANEHLQDVLFTCHTILKNQLEEGFPSLKQELIQLIKQMHKKYFPDLNEKGLDGKKKIERAISDLDHLLNTLLKALDDPEDPEILNIIQQIKNFKVHE
jgi:hypothetical protein